MCGRRDRIEGRCEEMKTDVMFSSKTDEWATPQDFFDQLDREFHFDLDPCADDHNHKCERYFTRANDGLSHSWGERGFLQSPLRSRNCEMGAEIGRRKQEKPNTLVVMLIPARTDTAYFHDYIYGKAEIRFVRGRLKFGNAAQGAPFPSMVVIFRNKSEWLDSLLEVDDE